MVIFVHGENSYLALDHVEKMRARFLDKFDASGMNLAEFPGKNGKLEIGSVMQSVQSPPFLGEKRMVIVKGLCEQVTRKPDATPWADALKRTPTSTIVILLNALKAAKVEKNHLYKELSVLEDAHTYDFPLLQGTALNAWAAQQSKELGLNIDRALLNQIVGMVGSDLWQLSGELKKLAAFANGNPVTQAMVSDFVRANFEDAMFDFVDAVSQQQSERALKLLEQQRLSGSTDFHLFAMLARQIRLLIGARAVLDGNPGATKADVARELGVHPFVAQKMLAQAKGFDASLLKKAHEQLFILDKKMKSGGVGATAAVDRAVVEMLKPFC